jgi:hypothetical protein
METMIGIGITLLIAAVLILQALLLRRKAAPSLDLGPLNAKDGGHRASAGADGTWASGRDRPESGRSGARGQCSAPSHGGDARDVQRWAAG